MLRNYLNGNVCLRKITDAFNVYYKDGTKPSIKYGTVEYDGSNVHYVLVHPDSNTVVTLDYAGDEPKLITAIRNQWFFDHGYKLAAQLSGAYFDNHSNWDTYGRPVGAFLHNWDKDWERHKQYICYPAKGKGYPTIYSDGFSLNWLDGWDTDFENLKGKMYWARGVGQSLTLNGRVDCSVGAENGRYKSSECVAMIGVTKSGDWIFVINVGKGLDHLTRAYLMRDLGAYHSFDLDGGGSTHLFVDDSFVTNPYPEPDPEPSTPDQTNPANTPAAFFEEWIGKRIDTDGNGFWCVDAFKQWCKEVLGYCWPTKNGWADGYWYYREEHAAEFEFITDVNDFRNGDWVIWPKDGKQPCPDSHIAMYYNGQCFGMRQGNANKVFELKTISFGKALGALRYIGYSDLPVATKTIDQLASEVIAGKWGNGPDRKARLTTAGYDYSAVQARVNELLARK